MIHKLYSAYDLPADHDTCHLFEHLIIRRFLKKTEKAGGNRAFAGELDGTTSESSVFFTYTLFTSESNTLFEKIINDKYGPSNQKKRSIWFWLCLLLIIFVVYHVYRSFFQRTAPSEHIALLHLDGEISTRNDTLKNFTDSLEEIYDNQR